MESFRIFGVNRTKNFLRIIGITDWFWKASEVNYIYIFLLITYVFAGYLSVCNYLYANCSRSQIGMRQAHAMKRLYRGQLSRDFVHHVI